MVALQYIGYMYGVRGLNIYKESFIHVFAFNNSTNFISRLCHSSYIATVYTLLEFSIHWPTFTDEPC